MADLNETIVDGLKIRRPASAADEAVRKGELDTALSGKANQAEVTQQITDATHPPVTALANQTLALSVGSDQALIGEVRLPDNTILQAAESGLARTFAPVAPRAILDLGKTLVSNVNAQRLNASGGVLATGTGTIDYTVDSISGQVTILAGNPGDQRGRERAHHLRLRSGSRRAGAQQDSGWPGSQAGHYPRTRRARRSRPHQRP